MNAAETIAAAIQKLEQMRAPGTWQGAGPWHVNGETDVVTEHHIMIADAWDADIADLIVTLHRTIDAQLEILRTADQMLRPGVGVTVINDALELARAILGEVS